MTVDVISEAGTGAPTTGTGGLSVPVGVHISEIRLCDLRFEKEHSLRLERDIVHLREVGDLQRAADQLAIDKALESSKALAEKHNDLIHTAEKKDDSYATKVDLGRLEATVSKINGAMAIIIIIATANFVKAWVGV